MDQLFTCVEGIPDFLQALYSSIIHFRMVFSLVGRWDSSVGLIRLVNTHLPHGQMLCVSWWPTWENAFWIPRKVNGGGTWKRNSLSVSSFSKGSWRFSKWSLDGLLTMSDRWLTQSRFIDDRGPLSKTIPVSWPEGAIALFACEVTAGSCNVSVRNKFEINSSTWLLGMNIHQSSFIQVLIFRRPLLLAWGIR